MGEARRRRIAQKKTITYRDLQTGRLEAGRLAGSPMETLLKRDDLHRRAEAGERVEVDVPCNGCVSCCYYGKVEVYPERERPEDLRHLDVVPHPDGGLALRKRADGACVHLGPSGCTVRAHRPYACRMYDCRVMATAGIRQTFCGHVSPAWVFRPKSPEDHALRTALQFESAAYKAKHPEASIEEMFSHATGRLAETMPKMLEFVEMLQALSPEKKAQLAASMRQGLERAWSAGSADNAA